jgi:hypothetical protein
MLVVGFGGQSGKAIIHERDLIDSMTWQYMTSFFLALIIEMDTL